MSKHHSCCGSSTATGTQDSSANHDAHRQRVREAYARVAEASNEDPGCGVGASCCGVSDCVINLSPNKLQVFREAFRVLKPGGRLAISDVVATVELPDGMRNDAGLITGCIGNASLIEDLTEMIRDAGFEQTRIQPKDDSKEFVKDWAPGVNVTDFVVSATIEAIKPAIC